MAYLDRCNFLGLQSLEYMRFQSDMVLFHQLKLTITKIQTDSVDYNVSTRGGIKLRRPRVRIRMHEQSLFVRTVRNYSDLPVTVTSCASVTSFRSALEPLILVAMSHLMLSNEFQSPQVPQPDILGAHPVVFDCSWYIDVTSSDVEKIKEWGNAIEFEKSCFFHAIGSLVRLEGIECPTYSHTRLI